MKSGPKQGRSDGGCSKKELAQGHKKLSKAEVIHSPKGKRSKP